MTIYAAIMERIITLPVGFTRSDEGRRFLSEVLPLTPSEIGKLKALDMLPEIDGDSNGDQVYTLRQLAAAFKAEEVTDGTTHRTQPNYRGKITTWKL